MEKDSDYTISDSAKLTGSLIAGKIFALLVTFGMPLFLTRYLSKNDYGLFSQFYLIITFIAFFFSISFQSNLFYFYPVAGSRERKSLVFLTFIFLTILSLVAVAFTGFPLLRKELIGDTELLNYYPLIIIGIFLFMPSYLIEPLYVVRKDFLTSIIYPPAEVLLRLILVIGLVLLRPGLLSICISIICSSAIVYIFVLIYAFKELNLSDISRKLIDFSTIRRQIYFILPFGIAMSLDILAQRFDRIICIRYLTPSDFAIYSIAFFGIPGIMHIYDSFTKVKVIEMTIKYHEKQMDAVSEIYKSLAVKAFSFSLPVLMIVSLYARKIIVLLFTDKYLDSVPFFRAYLISFLFFMLGAGLILRATGRTGDTLKSYLYSCILTLPATFFLIRSYGMWGAMAGALLNLIVPRILMIAFEVRYMKIRFRDYYPWDKILRIFLISFLTLIPFLLIEILIPGGIIITIFYGMVYILAVAIIEIHYDLFILPGEFIRSRAESLAFRPVINIFHWLIRYSGSAYLIRRIFARKNITIVMYHNPEEKVFKAHMNYLSRRYNFITLSDLIETLYSGKPHSLPEYPLLVTFDDGWKENFLLLDIFREHKMKPVIFLSSHLVDTNRKFWFTIGSNSVTESLKSKSAAERLLTLKNDYGYYPDKEFPDDRQALSREEILKMKDHTDFGSHTCSHPILTKCDFEAKASEISGSVARLKELLDIRVTSFAYPDGEYDNDVIGILKENNIKVARTIDVGWNNGKSDPYRLKVTGVSDNGSVTKLASELSGISMFIQYLTRGSLNGVKSGRL
jgi:O-antigen/teichoic acid export membrane protein/peptidoglycan/xylan/chitin deacetylase (PgdA/CDA1 family)